MARERVQAKVCGPTFTICSESPVLGELTLRYRIIQNLIPNHSISSKHSEAVPIRIGFLRASTQVTRALIVLMFPPPAVSSGPPLCACLSLSLSLRLSVSVSLSVSLSLFLSHTHICTFLCFIPFFLTGVKSLKPAWHQCCVYAQLSSRLCAQGYTGTFWTSPDLLSLSQAMLALS